MKRGDDPTECDVIVVGGGIAGLTAACALADEGLTVTVLEKEPVLGGRARSWPDEKTGDPVHIGPHIFMTCYANFLAFQDLIGAHDTIVWQDGQFISLVEGTDSVEIEHSELPPPYSFLPSLLDDPKISMRDLVSNWPVVQYAAELDAAEVARLDELNALAFLKGLGVTQNFIDRFWRFVCFVILNNPIETSSAGGLMRFYRHLIGNRLQFGFPDGGLGDTFAPQSERFLEGRGGRVLTDVTVESFVADDRRVDGVRLEDGRILRAENVVSALDPITLRGLARPTWIRRDPIFRGLVDFSPVPYECVHLWFDRKLTDRQFWSRFYDPNDLNSDFYDYSNIIRDWDRPYSQIASNIIWSHRVDGWSDDQIIEATVDELCEFLPQARDATLTHAVVNHVPLVIPAPRPGLEARRPTDPETSIRGLTVAGDWLQTHFPYTMESAATGGWMAAESVLRSLGRERSLVRERPEPTGLMPWLDRLGPVLPNRRRMDWLQ